MREVQERLKAIVLKLILLLVLIGTVVFGIIAYRDRTAIASLPKLDFEDDPEITRGHQPKICSGLETNHKELLCPENFAFFSAQDKSSDRYNGKAGSVPFIAVCCPLPANDILTEEHSYNVVGACPDSYIATGQSSNSCGENCFIRCTRINTKRYMLGNKHQGVYWKRPGTYPGGGRGGAKQILLPEIPVAIRYAAGYQFKKKGEGLWDKDGCLGVPIGSAVVEKKSEGCGGLYYRPLLFRESGRAVRTFPECIRLEGIEEKSPRCVVE